MKITKITPAESGLSESDAHEVFDHVQQFASYGFNKSHAAAYAAISFQTAALKTHHPEAFYAASMNMAIGDSKDLATFAGELKSRKIHLERPSVNRSNARFIPQNQNETISVLYGLAAIRGVGMKAGLAIQVERENNGPYRDLNDLRVRVGNALNKKALKSLIGAGALDDIIFSRRDAIEKMNDSAVGQVSQMSFFEEALEDTRPELEEFDLGTLAEMEFESYGFWHWTHPLRARVKAIKAANLSSLRALKTRSYLPKSAWIVAGVVDWDIRGTKSGGVMGVLTLSDSVDVYEVVAFDDTWNAIKPLCKKQDLVAMEVDIKEDNGVLRLTATKAVPLDKLLNKQKRAA